MKACSKIVSTVCTGALASAMAFGVPAILPGLQTANASTTDACTSFDQAVEVTANGVIDPADLIDNVPVWTSSTIDINEDFTRGVDVSYYEYTPSKNAIVSFALYSPDMYFEQSDKHSHAFLMAYSSDPMAYTEIGSVKLKSRYINGKDKVSVSSFFMKKGFTYRIQGSYTVDSSNQANSSKYIIRAQEQPKDTQLIMFSDSYLTTSASKLKKKAKTYKLTTSSTSKGKISVSIAKKDKKGRLSYKNGKLTIKKGTKAGTYKIKLKAIAAGNDYYLDTTKFRTIEVKVGAY